MHTKSPRRRDAAVTRKAILASARKAFARAGYDGVGLREIAASAGVTAMMVGRYFGSKEQLFAEAVADAMREPVILSSENQAAPDFAVALTRALVSVTSPDATPLDGLLILLNSASSPRAAEIGAEWINRGHQATLEALVKGPHPEERAGLFLALVAGLHMIRQMVEIPSLAGADAETLETLLLPIVRQLVENQAGSSSGQKTD